MNQSTPQILASVEPSTDLTPGQALERLAHCERRLKRRARSYFAAKQRFMAAREEWQRIDSLAQEARVYRPIEKVA